MFWLTLYTIPASSALEGQKADCWDNLNPLGVSGVLLTSFTFVVSQRRCLLVHSMQLAICKHFANIQNRDLHFTFKWRNSWRDFSPFNCYSHGKGGNYGKGQTDFTSVYEDRSNTLTRTLHTTDILGTVAARHGANNLWRTAYFPRSCTSWFYFLR